MKPQSPAPTSTCNSRRTSSPDKTCTLAAGWGTDHPGAGRCKLHGGSSPGGRAQGQRLQQEKLVHTYGLPRTVDPSSALLEEIARTAGHVDYLADQVRNLAPDALVWSLTRTDDVQASEWAGLNTTEAAAVNVWLQLYQAERAHLVKVCAAALHAGVQQRQVDLAEQQGQRAAALVVTLLARLDLTEAQRAAVPGLIREHLALTRAG